MTSRSQHTVIPFVGVILNDEVDRDSYRSFLEDLPVEVDRRTDEIPFDHTEYYRESMGTDLRRYWFSLSDHWLETKLADYKRTFIEFEREASEAFPVSDRPVNFDPGYVKQDQVVLASTKFVGHRVCIDDDMYAELTLLYENGSFGPMDWTYPDYRCETALSFFSALRRRYLAEIKQHGT